MNIILCGPPFSGKSYYGKLLAEHLSRPFIDTDRLIEQRYLTLSGQNLTCREVKLKEGEQLFRKLEAAVIELLGKSPGAIIAIGGGALFDEKNAAVLKKLGKLVLLKTAFSVLWQRLSQKPILPSYIDPHSPQSSFASVVESRTALCLLHADLCLETTHQTDEEILKQLSAYIHGA